MCSAFHLVLVILFNIFSWNIYAFGEQFNTSQSGDFSTAVLSLLSLSPSVTGVAHRHLLFANDTAHS